MMILLVLIGAYLIGSLPFGKLITWVFTKKDLIKEGSGNIGAANVYRTAGKLAGAFVFLLDVAKGYIPIFVMQQINPNPNWLILTGALVLIGHSYSIFLGFKGGKGASSTLGVVIGLGLWWQGLCAFGFWLVVVVITRYAFLASLLAIWTLFLIILLSFQPFSYQIFFLLLAVFITIKHWVNIRRFLKGEENRLEFFKKNGGDCSRN